MRFIMGFLRNLAFLIIAGILLYIFFPDIMKSVYQVFGVMLGPLAIVLLVVAALPRRRRY